MGLLSSSFSFSSSFPSFSLLLPRSRPDSKPEPHSVIEMKQRDGSKKKGRGTLVRLVSSAGTGYFYVAKKNKKGTVEKLQLRKYDPVVRRHVLFTEGKMIK